VKVPGSGGLREFERDLDCLLGRMRLSLEEDVGKRLADLKEKLVQLHEKGLVKINHSVMELVCAKHLILKGYEVDVEHCVADGLICDLYGVKGFGTTIVEVETGFVPPEHALDPVTYCKARIASKIARYSNYADRFALGIPPHYVIQIPPALIKPPRYRRLGELREVKKLCDVYYKNPPVSLEEIRNARIHTIYIIDVEKAMVREVDPDTYIENASFWRY